MTSTLDKGNAFRDAVADLLEAAGYECKTEVRRDHKKVDIEARISGRRPCEPYHLRGFTLEEARRFVSLYFPIRAKLSMGANNPLWLQGRLNRILDSSFDELLMRPVHAQMLCEIATQPQLSLDAITEFQLYDRFLHLLFEREMDKVGRFPEFDIGIRRYFNASLAWWLWERGGASTTELTQIPLVLCNLDGRLPSHDFDDDALKRELIAGCLIEKGDGKLFFGHRSLQEFLVAEHLMFGNCLMAEDGSPKLIDTSILTSEVLEFSFHWIVVADEAMSENKQFEVSKRMFSLIYNILMGGDAASIGFALKLLRAALQANVQVQAMAVLAWIFAICSRRSDVNKLAAGLFGLLFENSQINSREWKYILFSNQRVDEHNFCTWAILKGVQVAMYGDQYPQVHFLLSRLGDICLGEVGHKLSFDFRTRISKELTIDNPIYASAEIYTSFRQSSVSDSLI
jgi:hypothetical protein